MSEATIQANIMHNLRKYGWAVKPTVTNLAGCPDILYCIQGRFVGIEVKAPKGRLSEIQKYQLDRIRTHGEGIAFMATSWKEVKNKLIEEGIVF